ncbi:MAG TPA: HAD family phosphatase, partial [Verrucomicrobiae bacterium]|nr:HAD family phosphatase [Verrucomicrobiae bacterium]
MKKFQAVIYDMDGVIVDSEPFHEQAFLEIFEQMGYGQTHGIDFTQYYGRSDRALWIDFVATHKPPQSLEFLTDWKQRHFLEILRAKQPIFPALPALVEKTAARYKLAVASGSWH